MQEWQLYPEEAEFDMIIVDEESMHTWEFIKEAEKEEKIYESNTVSFCLSAGSSGYGSCEISIIEFSSGVRSTEAPGHPCVSLEREGHEEPGPAGVCQEDHGV